MVAKRSWTELTPALGGTTMPDEERLGPGASTGETTVWLVLVRGQADHADDANDLGDHTDEVRPRWRRLDRVHAASRANVASADATAAANAR